MSSTLGVWGGRRPTSGQWPPLPSIDLSPGGRNRGQAGWVGGKARGQMVRVGCSFSAMF